MASDSHPRLPLASLPGTEPAGPNDWPPSVDRVDTSLVPDEDLAVHSTLTAGSAARFGVNAIRGGCSLRRDQGDGSDSCPAHMKIHRRPPRHIRTQAASRTEAFSDRSPR